MTTNVFQAGTQQFTVEDLPKRSGIRWAAGSPDGPRSSTWRLWGDKKGDVYLSMRSQGGRLKASFHRDRRCSVGFTQEFEAEARERFGVQSRHMARWNLHDGEVVRAAQILIPNSDLSTFDGKDAGQMRWLPAPGAGNVTVVTIFIAEPPESFNWTDPQTNGDIIGTMQTPTRFTWVVSGIQSLDAATNAFIESARSKVLASASTHDLPPNDPGVRLAIMGHSGTPADLVFYDLCALRPEHTPQ